jgi:hypothetical protein
MIEAAFNTLVGLRARPVTLTRPGGITVSISVAPSSYFRKFEGPSETTFDGREFIISRRALDATTFPLPLKRGDRIEDPETGLSVISEINEMYGLGSKILGYRVRVG